MHYRILQVLRSVNPVGGGPVEGTAQLTAALQKEGHEIDWLTLDTPADPWVRKCPIRCHAVGVSWEGYGYSPHLASWLRGNRHRYDAVVVNGVWQYHSFGAWRALVGTDTPYFVFTHGMLDPWFKRTYPLKHMKKWLYWPWADYRVLRDARAVLFTTEAERQLARQSFWLYKCREFVVSHGTAGPSGDATFQRRVFQERFPQLSGKRCLLFLGRVHVKKGPDLLFHAFAQVLARMPESATRDVQLVMAGPNDHAYGREMAELVGQIGLEDRVTWTGLLTTDEKWGAFYAAEAFVLPSHQENFGTAVVEALACGVPVLISNQVNIWRDICEDAAGFAEPDDIPGTIRLLKRWLATERDEWKAMRGQAQLCFRHRFQIERAAASVIRAFRETGTTPHAAP